MISILGRIVLGKWLLGKSISGAVHISASATGIVQTSGHTTIRTQLVGVVTTAGYGTPTVKVVAACGVATTSGKANASLQVLATGHAVTSGSINPGGVLATIKASAVGVARTSGYTPHTSLFAKATGQVVTQGGAIIPLPASSTGCLSASGKPKVPGPANAVY